MTTLFIVFSSQEIDYRLYPLEYVNTSRRNYVYSLPDDEWCIIESFYGTNNNTFELSMMDNFSIPSFSFLTLIVKQILKFNVWSNG